MRLKASGRVAARRQSPGRELSRNRVWMVLGDFAARSCGPLASHRRGGRSPYNAVAMFKILILAARHTVSDERMEFRDRLSWLRFLGFDLGAPTPDRNTIWTFRERLIRNGAVDALFAAFDRELGRWPLACGPTALIVRRPTRLGWRARAGSPRSTARSRRVGRCPGGPPGPMPESRRSAHPSSMSSLLVVGGGCLLPPNIRWMSKPRSSQSHSTMNSPITSCSEFRTVKG